MTYYCTVHEDENQQELAGQQLDACNSHMVFDAFYDDGLDQYLQAPRRNMIVWVMERDPEAKFGYRFKTPRGIPL